MSESVNGPKIQHSLIHNSQLTDWSWGCSSVGRAVALQAIGQEFESPQLHQFRESVRAESVKA